MAINPPNPQQLSELARVSARKQEIADQKARAEGAAIEPAAPQVVVIETRREGK